VAIVIAAIISPNPAPIGTEHSNSSSPAISTRQLEEEFAAVFQAAANQKMQEIFNAIHPIGTAKRVVVHDVTITDWKRGQVTNRAEDIVQLTIRYTLYWQGPITTDGYTKIVHTFDVETERYTNCQILATNGATNGDVAETLGYIGGALLYEALSD
jgi:hypothetical protein